VEEKSLTKAQQQQISPILPEMDLKSSDAGNAVSGEAPGQLRKYFFV
jgi:hypothetical protein